MDIKFYQKLYPVPIEMMGFSGSSHGKESACLVWSLGQEDSLGKEWLAIPAFLPGESCRQRNLVGYSPCGRKELDTIEWLLLSLRWSYSFYSSVIVVCHIDFTCIKESFNPWDKSHFYQWHRILVMYCWIWLASNLLRIFVFVLFSDISL